jgi:hypothetical protein
MHYRECEFWKDLFLGEFPTPELTQLVQKVENRFFLPRLLLGLVSRRDRWAYQAYGARLFGYVSSRTGKPIVIDSSKSARRNAGRFLALSKLAGQDLYVLHLVRNGLATMESLVATGRNWVIEGYAQAPRWPALRAALGWVSANILASVLGRRLGPNRYMLLRYEDLVEDPATALRKIGQFCDFDAEGLIEDINCDHYFQVGHMVGGNRVRLQGEIKLRKDGKRRLGGRLKLHHWLVFALVGAWLHRRYDYPL